MKQKKKFLKPSISYISMPVQDILAGSGTTPTMSLFDNAIHEEGGIEGGNGGDGLAKQGESFEEDWDEDWE